MSRKEFMERLEKLLWNISESEREEALQYYNDYFDDAGEENEAKVIEELVSPEQVAQKIKAGLSDSASEFSEQGYRDTRFEARGGELSAGQGTADDRGQSAGRKRDTNFWKILAIALLCILLLPVILPVGGGILIGVLGIVAGIIALFIGIVVAGFVILAAGIIVAGIGVAQAFVTPAAGIALAGTGCILTALGVLLSLVTIWCCVKVVPWIIRGIVGLISYPFRKAGAGK